MTTNKLMGFNNALRIQVGGIQGGQIFFAVKCDDGDCEEEQWCI